MSEKFFKNNADQANQPKRIDLISGDIDEETLKSIVEIEQAAFPEKMQSDLEEIRGLLGSENAINVLMRNSNNEIIGCLSAMPQDEEYSDLVQHDPAFTKDSSALYIESIGVKPGNDDAYLSVTAFRALIQEAIKRGYKKITMHARVGNGVSNVIQRLYNAKFIRRIENWHNFEEAFDYLEIDIN